MKNSIPNLIIVDDHELFRDGIKTMFQLSGIANIIAEASNGIELLEILKTKLPDIVLIDIDMPIMNGIDATREAIKKHPTLNILALSMFGESKYYYQMIEAGARGFILKTANKSELEEAIGKVAMGHTYFSTELLQDMLSSHPHKSKATNNASIHFNEKEIEIMKHMCLGLSADEIAEKVYLSPKTVANYRNLMLNKTGCKNSTNLIFYAIQNNIIQA